MSASAVDLCRADGGVRRHLSTPRTVVLLVVLLGILGFEITNAVTDGIAKSSGPAGTVTVDLTSAIRPGVVHHVVPPVPTTADDTLAARPATPLTASGAPNLAGRAAPHVATPAVRPATVSTAAPSVATRTTQTSMSSAGSFGCGAALSYLASHAAPGFRFECPGYALGHQAMTCIDVPGVCPGSHLIVIDVPCSAAYMNEASNSWVLEGLRHAPIDPYGYCH